MAQSNAPIPSMTSETGPQPGDTAYSQPTAAPTDQYNSQSNGHATGSQFAYEVKCGPLLNYRRMSDELSDTPIWHGSVLIVTNIGAPTPSLSLKCTGAVDGAVQTQSSLPEKTFQAEKLFEDEYKGFWRFLIDTPIQEFEAFWQYKLEQNTTASPQTFAVPSKAQSMRILFHSCNGFSIGTDEESYNGAVLWKDVLRFHQEKPFHVMLGGGDQIYNDNVRVTGPLKEWTSIGNPRKRRDYKFSEELRAKCDEHYYNNYIKWYSTEPFKSANGVIPQINIWDDHDIIDGFGSYTDHFMQCHVFRGIGGVAHKYYMLFQHHLAPPRFTFTSDIETSQHEGGGDPIQEEVTFVLDKIAKEPQYIVGSKPGPYVAERSKSLYAQLGARIGLLGIDARLERTRKQVNYPETYDQIFARIDEEYTKNKNLKHLILLLGIPIAYPRLQWLENIFSSPIIGPIRFLNKRFGIAGGLFNKFDGQIDLLDDLDDHYTARHHKSERKHFILRLQEFSKKHSVRVTMLGGDVHLAAGGRFYSKPSLKIPAEHDHRYMTNIVSSAITNKPPPSAIANLLARRNKIHHLDHHTDETMFELFDHDPGHSPTADEKSAPPSKKTIDSNRVTMPSRNFAIIAESSTPGPAGAAAATATAAPLTASEHPTIANRKFNMRKALHAGEVGAGSTHAAAGGLLPSGLGGPAGLDVTLRVEIDKADAQGKTEGYGFSIPMLDASPYQEQGSRW